MFAAVILAGGAARRVGGATKPALQVGGEALLTRVLAAASDARQRIVVGPQELAGLVPAGATLTREHPPGGGPVAAIAAGLSLLDRSDRSLLVAVLAADLPFLSARTLATLRDSARQERGDSGGGDSSADAGARCVDGAVLVDAQSRPQWLAGVWRLGALAARLDALGDPAGGSVRGLVAGLRVAHVHIPDGSGPPPWFDCDTTGDLRRAEEWARDGTR